MQKEIGVFRTQSNAEILNGIRTDASMDYQRRIPEVDQANINTVINKLTNYKPAQNEFLDALINQIGLIIVRSASWTNPLAVFKKGLMQHGDSVEEIAADMLEAHSYSPDRDYGEKALFGQERPSIETAFHRINRQDFYKVTINKKMLDRAFANNETGLSSLIGQLMDAPTKSDQYDEFLLMSQLLSQNEKNGGFFKVRVADFSNLETGQIEARDAMKRVKALGYELPILSREYNAAHMPISANPEDLMLIGTPNFLASIDVDGLAPIFHMDKATTPNERTVAIPERFWGIKGAQGALTTKEFFQVYDTLFTNTSQANPVGLYDNFFLHHHQIMSLSKFAPTVLFTSDSESIIVASPYSVTSVATPVVTDAAGAATDDVVRGSLYSLSAATVTSPTGGNVGVAYSVTGALSTRTYVTRNGMLYVAGDEAATGLTVTAITTNTDPTNPMLDGKTASKVLTVSGAVKANWPNTAGALAALSINDVDVPAFAVGTYAYAVTLPAGSVVTQETVDAQTVGGPDVTTTIVKGAPGYTVTVAVDAGTGAAKSYVVTVTVP